MPWRPMLPRQDYEAWQTEQSLTEWNNYVADSDERRAQESSRPRGQSLSLTAEGTPSPSNPPPPSGNLNPGVAGGESVTPGRRYSPFDDTFRRHAGDLAGNDEFISIVAAGTRAESGWDPNNRSGDNGHSWGLFQMHDGGAGAGMGERRLDPDAASAVMVPRYAEGYRLYKARGYTGPDLAAAVAAYAERPEGWDTPGSRARTNYASHYAQITGANFTPPEPSGFATPGGTPSLRAPGVTPPPGASLPDPLQQWGDYLGSAAATVGRGAEEVGRRAQSAGDDLSRWKDYLGSELAQVRPEQIGEAVTYGPRTAVRTAQQLGPAGIANGGVLGPMAAGMGNQLVSDVIGSGRQSLERARPDLSAANEERRLNVGPLSVTPLDVAEVAVNPLNYVPGPSLGRAARPLASDLGRAAGRVADDLAPRLDELGSRALTARQPGHFTTEPPEWVRAGAQAAPDENARAANILLRKYPEEVRGLIDQAAANHPDLMETARRGVLGDDVIADLAQMAGDRVENVVKRWKPGQAQNAETILAMREALAGQTRRVSEAQAAFREADSTENLANLAEAITQHRAIQEAVTGVTAEAGRALRQFRQSVTGLNTPEDRLSALLRLAYKNNTNSDELRGFLRTVNLDDPVGVANAARTLYQPSLSDVAGWLWYNSLLSSPVGRVRDSISSAMASLSYPLETAAAVPFDVAQSRLTGSPRTVRMGEVKAEYVGMLSALSDAWKDARSVLRYGFTEGQARADLAVAAREPSSIPLPGGRRAPIPDPVRAGVSTPSRLITANDAFWGALAQNASIRAQAVRLAEGEGLRGPALAERVGELATNPTDDMVTEAIRTRRYRVWQEDSKFSKALGGIRDIPLVGRIILPFVQTPVNLARYAAERSPLAVPMLLGEQVGAALGKTTRPTPQHTSEMLGRAAIGSTIMLGMYQLAEKGEITGAAPKDDAERDASYRTGAQPYSVRVGDQWHNYQTWGLAPLLASAAAIHEAVTNGHSDSAAAAFAAGVFGVAKSLTDQPFMQGITSFAEAWDDPGRRGISYLEQLARMPVPSGLQFLTRATDPLVRDPDGPWEALVGAFPGASRTLPPKQDAMGRDVERAPTQQGPLALLPTRPTLAKDDPVEQELARLQQAGFKVQPHAVPRQMTVAEQTVPLERGERRQYQAAAGKLAYATLSALVSDPRWSRLPDEAKSAAIQDVMDTSRATARAQLAPLLVPRAVEAKLQAVNRKGERQ